MAIITNICVSLRRAGKRVSTNDAVCRNIAVSYFFRGIAAPWRFVGAVQSFLHRPSSANGLRTLPKRTFKLALACCVTDQFAYLTILGSVEDNSV